MSSVFPIPGPRGTLSCIFSIILCSNTPAFDDCYFQTWRASWWAESGVFQQGSMENMQDSIPYRPGLGNMDLEDKSLELLFMFCK